MFNTISDVYKYAPCCILCNKPTQFYIAGYERIPFDTKNYVYYKSLIENNLLHSLDKDNKIVINIETNEVLEGKEIISNLLSSHFDFFQKCRTCLFQINYQFWLKKLKNNKFLSKSSPLREELMYTMNSKKIFIYTHYNEKYNYTVGKNVYEVHDPNVGSENNSATYIYANNKHLPYPNFKLKNFKNIKKLNSMIKTLLVFG